MSPSSQQHPAADSGDRRGARRGRPPKDSARPPLTRVAVGEAVLAIAGDSGFPAVSMRSLADRLGVTVRALYNVVSDRQDAVDLGVEQMMSRLPAHEFDASDWRTSLRQWYRQSRSVYRGLRRALLISLDETPTAAVIPDERIIAPEALLAFLVEVGLTPQQAASVRGRMLLDVFAFSLLVDLRYDESPEALRDMMFQPVPAPWLAAHPDIDAPLSRLLATGPTTTPDAELDLLANREIAWIESVLSASGGGAAEYGGVTDPIELNT